MLSFSLGVRPSGGCGESYSISLFQAQLEENRQYQQPSTGQLRSMLLEPTVNVVINKLTKELESTKTRLEESQSELSAWKFTQDR